MATQTLKKLAVHKFASCDGCQLSLLDLEDELLAFTDLVDVAYFREATRREMKGPYDIALVEGSITTAHDLERLRRIRQESAFLMTIGACATAGGIQALRNFASLETFKSRVYPSPEFIKALPTSTPIQAHVKVDFELRGCPVSKQQLLFALLAVVRNEKPQIPSHSVCVECKLRGNMCVSVLGMACLGPLTHAGCGALCPSFDRGCYGCFGPAEAAQPQAFAQIRRAPAQLEVARRALGTFNVASPEFLAAADKLGQSDPAVPIVSLAEEQQGQ